MTSTTATDHTAEVIMGETPAAEATIPPQGDLLSLHQHFVTGAYTIVKTDFLDTVRGISLQHLSLTRKSTKLNPLYPVYQTANLTGEEALRPFLDYVAQTGWNILNSQGYAMDHLQIAMTEVWCQEHHLHSSMEYHTHGHGSQLSGFYFLDVPKDSSIIQLHDPRPGKNMTNLPERNGRDATMASSSIIFAPREGLLFFTNSYVPHSFTRHGGKKPLRFIHFNLAVAPLPPAEAPEII